MNFHVILLLYMLLFLLELKCRVTASSEWKILYKIGKDKDGLLRKEAVREVYDGSLFTKLAAARINDENQA